MRSSISKICVKSFVSNKSSNLLKNIQIKDCLSLWLYWRQNIWDYRQNIDNKSQLIEDLLNNHYFQPNFEKIRFCRQLFLEFDS